MSLGTTNYLTAAQLAMLTPAELQSATILNGMSQVNAGSTPPYIFMSVEEVQKINIYAANITPAVIAKMRATIFSQLTTYQLSCLTDEQTSGISKECIQALSVDKVRAMSHTCSLNAAAVAALTAAQAAAISIDFKWMSVDWISALSSSALAGLTFNQLSQLNVNVLSEACKTTSVMGVKFQSVFGAGVRNGLYLNFIAKSDPLNLGFAIRGMDVKQELIGVLGDETLCAIMAIRDDVYGDGGLYIAHLFESESVWGDTTNGIVEALNHSPNFVQKLWQASCFNHSMSIIQSIFKQRPGVPFGLTGMVWTTLAQQSPSNFLALGSSVTSAALVKMCEYSPTALSIFSSTQISQLLSTHSDFFQKLEASTYLSKQVKLNIELLCYGVSSSSPLSKYFNGGPLAYLLNDNLDYTNRFDLNIVSVTLDARNFASWYSDTVLLDHIPYQATLMRDMYKASAQITWLNGNTTAREHLVSSVYDLFNSLGMVNSGIIELGAPPVGASDTDVEGYCIKVLGKIGQMSSAISMMKSLFKTVTDTYGALRFTTIDSYGLELEESAAAFLLNGSPSMGQAGGLTYRSVQGYTFADASYVAITETLNQIKQSFENCASGIEGVMRNKKIEELRLYYRDIFAGITGALSLLSNLASGAAVILQAVKEGAVKSVFANVTSTISTSFNNIFSIVNGFENIHGWGQSTSALNFYHLANSQISEAIDPRAEIYKGMSRDKLDYICGLQKETGVKAMLLVNKALANISSSASASSNVTTQSYSRQNIGDNTLVSSPSLFNIDLQYNAGDASIERLQHQVTAEELGVDANHKFQSGETYNILLPELNNAKTGCFARELQLKFVNRAEIVGQIPNGVGGYTPKYQYFTDMNSSVVNYYM